MRLKWKEKIDKFKKRLWIIKVGEAIDKIVLCKKIVKELYRKDFWTFIEIWVVKEFWEGENKFYIETNIYKRKEPFFRNISMDNVFNEEIIKRIYE